MHFSSRQKIQFRHCDPVSIVFYPCYFKLLNEVDEDFFSERLGWPFEQIHPDNGGPTVAIKAEFLVPSRNGDHLDINMSVMNFGTSSLNIQPDVECNGEVRFSLQHTMVCIGRNERPMPWPEHVRTNMKKIEGACVET